MKNAMTIKFLGAEDPHLNDEIASNVATSKNPIPKDVAYISSIKRPVFKDITDLSNHDMEDLKQLFSCWEVSLVPENIKSHRRVIGPIIVRAKKILFPILVFLLRPLVAQQQRFNAQLLKILGPRLFK